MVNLDILTSIPLLKPLNHEQFSLLVATSNLRNVKKKKKVYRIGEDIENVFFAIKGSIRMGSDIGNNKTLAKHIAYEKEIFGENILNSNSRTEYAEALKDSTVISIDKSVFQHILGENSQFANKFTEIIIERINNIEQRMKNFIFMKAHKRIAHFLKQTAISRGIKIGIDEVLINHGMSHKDISYLTDTSRQTVTRVLSELKHSNLIHFSSRKPNKILIRDLAAL
jgi:CRP-like cAMP-binding protein